MGEIIQLDKPKDMKPQPQTGVLKIDNAELVSRYNVRNELLVLKSMYEAIKQDDGDLAETITRMFCDSKAGAYFMFETTAHSPANLGVIAHVAHLCCHEWIGGHNGIFVQGPVAEVTADPSWGRDDES